MIELNEDQLRMLNEERQPVVVINPQTRQEFVLIDRGVYEKVRGFLRPLGRGWDNPADDDLIREDA